MKIYLLLFCFVLAFSPVSEAQQTANYLNNWYLGTGVGISFNSGVPVNVPSSITAYEVTTSFSDGDGNTLFYVGATSPISNGNGFTVWDASHATMPNGDISVNYSQSCGLTAVPVIGNCDQYYIFSLAVIGGANYGLRYSKVDMTLPGNGTVPSPLGDIVSGQKDILVFSTDTLAEKLKIVQKGNTEDFWIITRSVNNDLFYSFEVTAAGVNPVPVISTISATNWPTSIGSPIFSWIAINKNRDMIAEANGFGPDVKLFNFDNQTGVLSLAEVLIPTGTFGVDIPYGIEFSPSGEVLYVSRFAGGNNTYISSFDITAGVGSIAATMQDFLVGVNATAEYSGLIKGRDGKIYGSRNGYSHLITLETPENYMNPNLTIPGYDPTPGLAIIGMPNMSYYYHPDNFIDTLAGLDRSICPNAQTTIGVSSYDSIWATYSWEPAAMVLDASNASTLTIPLAADQEFVLHTIRDCGDTIISDTVMVTVSCALPVELADFDVERNGDNADVFWSTYSELNSSHFDVERSTDGVDFQYVGSVLAAGNSQEKIDYEFIDYRPEIGLNYYRLKQVDIDGTTEYSDVRSVLFEANDGLILYPNPASNFIVINSSRVEIAEISILSNIGKLILNKEFSNSSMSKKMDIDNLSAGIYWIKVLSSSGQYYNLKFTKI